MNDFRHRPLESPVVWCIHCSGLRPTEQSVKVMKTIYHVSRFGVFPFGVCSLHTVHGATQVKQECPKCAAVRKEA